MAKNWWFKFDFRVWQTDSNLRKCSLETRGFWIAALCAMHESDTFQIEGNYDEIGWLIGCSSEIAARCVLELKRTNTADVTLGNGSVTLLSRRLKRELSDREKTRLRVRKHRCNGDVTPQSKSKSKSNKKEEEERETATPLPTHENEAVAIYFETFPNQPINLWQQECITDRISDLDRWRRAVTVWKTNNWVARNVANMLDYYDKLDEREKKYGAPKPSYQEQREQRAIEERNFLDAVRREVAERDGQLPQTNVVGSSRQLRAFSPEPDDGREGLPC